MTYAHAQMEPARSARSTVLTCLFLALATAAVYWPVLRCDFVDFDDNIYVTENALVRSGLTLDGIVTAFTTRLHGLWIPLTRISLMLDHSLWGLDPAGFHLTNLLLHVANTVLVFLALRLATGAQWRSAFVAALFALHPLHVESVAWVTERKDVLCTFFMMLSLFAYAGYARRGSRGKYALAFLAFGCALMAKPVVVVLPVLLLALDVWPLARLPLSMSSTKASKPPPAARLRRLLLEKAPFFLAAAAAGVATILAHDSTDGLTSFEALPLGVRSANALLSYAMYLKLAIWPADLAVLYPHRGLDLSMLRVGLAAIPLVLLSAVTILAARRRPYLLAGWTWYIVALLPVIGFIQFGSHSMADRFTYIPLLGVFVMVAWGAEEWCRRGNARRVALAAAALVVVAVAIVTRLDLAHWKNSLALFERAVAVTEDNYLIHSNLGVELAERGRPEDALRHFEESLRIKPGISKSHNGIGVLLARRGQAQEAKRRFETAIRLDPTNADAFNNLGLALAGEGKLDEAVRQHREAVRLQPDKVEFLGSLAYALDQFGRPDLAIEPYRKALRLAPDNSKLHAYLGVALRGTGDLAGARQHLQEALRLEPGFEWARRNLEQTNAMHRGG